MLYELLGKEKISQLCICEFGDVDNIQPDRHKFLKEENEGNQRVYESYFWNEKDSKTRIRDTWLKVGDWAASVQAKEKKLEAEKKNKTTTADTNLDSSENINKKNAPSESLNERKLGTLSIEPIVAPERVQVGKPVVLGLSNPPGQNQDSKEIIQTSNRAKGVSLIQPVELSPLKMSPQVVQHSKLSKVFRVQALNNTVKFSFEGESLTGRRSTEFGKFQNIFYKLNISHFITLLQWGSQITISKIYSQNSSDISTQNEIERNSLRSSDRMFIDSQTPSSLSSPPQESIIARIPLGKQLITHAVFISFPPPPQEEEARSFFSASPRISLGLTLNDMSEVTSPSPVISTLDGLEYNSTKSTARWVFIITAATSDCETARSILQSKIDCGRESGLIVDSGQPLSSSDFDLAKTTGTLSSTVHLFDLERNVMVQQNLLIPSSGVPIAKVVLGSSRGACRKQKSGEVLVKDKDGTTDDKRYREVLLVSEVGDCFVLSLTSRGILRVSEVSKCDIQSVYARVYPVTIPFTIPWLHSMTFRESCCGEGEGIKRIICVCGDGSVFVTVLRQAKLCLEGLTIEADKDCLRTGSSTGEFPSIGTTNGSSSKVLSHDNSEFYHSELEGVRQRYNNSIDTYRQLKEVQGKVSIERSFSKPLCLWERLLVEPYRSPCQSRSDLSTDMKGKIESDVLMVIDEYSQNSSAEVFDENEIIEIEQLMQLMKLCESLGDSEMYYSSSQQLINKSLRNRNRQAIIWLREQFFDLCSSSSAESSSDQDKNLNLEWSILLKQHLGLCGIQILFEVLVANCPLPDDLKNLLMEMNSTDSKVEDLWNYLLIIQDKDKDKDKDKVEDNDKDDETVWKSFLVDEIFVKIVEWLIQQKMYSSTKYKLRGENVNEVIDENMKIWF